MGEEWGVGDAHREFLMNVAGAQDHEARELKTRSLLNRRATNGPGILGCMTLQRIKMTLSAVWVLSALVFAVALGADLSRPAMMAVAAAGLLPPLAILLLWNEPQQTMSESIHEARQ